MSLKRAIVLLAGVFCALLMSCNNIFHLIASSGEEPSSGEYTVRFDKNGGDIEASPSSMIAKAPTYTVMLPQLEPEWEDHIFTGWNTNEDGSGAEFTRDTTVRANMVVFAQWMELPPGSLIVRFDKNNNDVNSPGAHPQNKAVIPPETSIDALPSEPTRIGYYFDGWNTREDGSGGEFTEDTPVSDHITVYAQWDPYRCIVTFDSNHDDESRSAELDQKITVTYSATNIVTSIATSADERPNQPTRDHYNFIGWNTSADGSGDEFTEDTPVGILDNEERIIYLTVYAQWEEKTYTISGTITAEGSDKLLGGATVEIKRDSDGLLRTFNPTESNGNFTLPPVPWGEYDITVSCPGYKTKTDTFTVTDDDTINFKLTPITYTIDYDKNAIDATGNMESSTHTYDIDKALTANVFSRSGYRFAGWARYPTGTAVFENGDSVINLTTTDGETITLYAVWTFSHYRVSFDANGSTSGTVPVPQEVEVGSAMTIPPQGGLLRTNYNFGGWNTQNNGNGNNYNDGSSYTPTGNTRDITLYARWYSTVTFNGNDATGGSAPGPMTPNAGSNITIPGAGSLVKTGHTFDGWNINAAGTGTNRNAGDDYTPTGNIELFAKWTKASYTITYRDVGGGSFSGTYGLNTPERHTYGTETNLVNPTKTRNTFEGWFKNSNGTDAVTSLGATEYTATITLYAKWTPESYGITYLDVGGGLFSGTYGPNTPDRHTYGTVTTLVSPTRPGYTFGGWFGTSGGTGDPISYLGATAYTNDITLYAKWVVTYTITYRDVGDVDFSGMHGSGYPTTHTSGTATTLVSPTKTGYTFEGWFTNSAGTEGPLTSLPATGFTTPITLYAKWTPRTYSITYMDVDGDPFSGTHGDGYPDEHTYGTATNLVNPTKDHSSFEGWFRNSDGTGAVTSLSATGFTGDIILYAKWAGESYTIYYLDVGGGSFSGTFSSSYPGTHTYGKVTTLVSPVAPDGKTFVGWFTNSGGTEGPLTTLSATDYTGNINLYAKWDVITYTITYNINGGTGTTPGPQYPEYGSSFTTHGYSGFSRTGYTFTGWNDLDTGDDYAANLSYPARNLNLYAQWDPISYRVIFHANGGSGTMENQPFTYDSPQNLDPNTFDPPVNKTFAGWAISEEGTVVYANGQRVSTNLASTQGATFDLYAQWSAITAPTPEKSGTIFLIPSNADRLTEVLVQLYRFNISSQTLEAIGPPVRPNVNGHYLLPERQYNDGIYFITASLDGYNSKVGTVTSSASFPVDLTLDEFIETRRIAPQRIEQMIMELMQGGFRN